MPNIKTELNGYFITGSDTGVGKTWVSCQLIKQLRQQAISVKVRKPVESGCEEQDNKLVPADGNALLEANKNNETLQQVTPFRFKAAVAPDRAAQLENKTIYLSDLQKAVCNNILADDLLIVEGAGGFYSPIAENGLNSDLAKWLGLPVIIVIKDCLGAINQSLLTIKAVEHEGLEVKAVILNEAQESVDDQLDNLSELTKRTRYPVYSCAYNGALDCIKL